MVVVVAYLQVRERVEGGEVGDDDEEAGGRVHRQDGEAVAPPKANCDLQESWRARQRGRRGRRKTAEKRKAKGKGVKDN